MKIENTDLDISGITLGTWVFGGNHWQGAKEADCIDAVKASIDCGINCIDTAPIYGNGRSEEIIGKAIKGQRDKVIIATKCGLAARGNSIINNLKADSIKQEVDDSLSRLRTDMIDIYQCHWPDKDTPIAETMSALMKIKAAGKIRYIGLSNYSAAQIKEAQALDSIVTSQNEYSMLKRDIEDELLPYLIEQNIGLLVYGPLAGGILTGKYQEQPKFKGADARNFLYKFYDEAAFKQTSEMVSKLKAIGKPLGQLAINWARQQKGTATVLVGCRNRAQVEENVKALQWELSVEELRRIEEIITTGVKA